VAAWLRQAELGTLLMDLLTADEERIDRRTAELRFDIDLLAERLVVAADWLASEPATRDLGLGLFGASTGAAATGAGHERLRGIPAIGRSVSGAIRGTQSEGECADDRAPRPRPDPHAPGGGLTRAVAVGGLGRSTRGP
jgi:hypothetical protein